MSKGSRFDPDYEIRRGRAAFLKQLVVEISKPVMPEDGRIGIYSDTGHRRILGT